MSTSLDVLKERLSKVAEKSGCKVDSYDNDLWFVRVDVRELGEKGILQQEMVVDLSSLGKQMEYFGGIVSSDVLNYEVFEFARKDEEVLMCWKGYQPLIAEMLVVESDGRKLGPLIDVLKHRKDHGSQPRHLSDVSATFKASPARRERAERSFIFVRIGNCLLYTSPSPRDRQK